MRMVLAVLVAVVSLPVSAANIRFEPPNPDSQTAVTAHVLVKGCGSESVADVTRSGNIIGITIAASSTCAPESESLQDLRADLGVLPPGIYDVVASPGALLIAIAEGFLPVTEATRVEVEAIIPGGNAVVLDRRKQGFRAVHGMHMHAGRAMVLMVRILLCGVSGRHGLRLRFSACKCP